MTATKPDNGLEPLFACVEEINALTGWRRHAELIEFARWRQFSPPLMLVEGTVGRIAREAWTAFRADLDANTPARAWDQALKTLKTDHPHILRALKIDPSDRSSFDATSPFRIIREQDRAWVAGAVGCERLLDLVNGYVRKDRSPLFRWCHLDITDVVLWSPRTGEVRLAGDTGPSLVEPADMQNGRYTVFTDGYAFFRAWADARAEEGARIRAAMAAKRVVPHESIDSCLPGILVIGDMDKIHWRNLGATTLVAGPGTDPHKLQRAIFRAANLPRVEAPSHLQVAA